MTRNTNALLRAPGNAFTHALLALALGMLALAGCDPAMEPDDSGILAPPPAGQGYQYAMTTTLEPGVEVEHCKFVKAPAEGMYINHDEVRYTRGSHHFLLFETASTEIPAAKDDGTPVDTSGVFDCSDGPTNGWNVTRLVGGSQNADGSSMVALPPGVAIPVEPGRVLLMNAHYINATDAVMEPEVRINLHTIAKDEVQEEGDILFLYNPFIKISAGGQSRARMRCTVHHDITIMNVQSHMHERGVDYAAMVEGQEPFYTNDRWADVPVGDLSGQGGVTVPAGAKLDYFCDYQNFEARDVYQGPRSTDEMCMLIGSYYPADLAMANCLEQSGTSHAGEWVGNGTAACAQSLQCVQASLGSADIVKALTVCMLDASPDVSKELSAAVTCLFRSQDPLQECAAPIETCQAL